MLAKAERPTHDFAALARYLVMGTERPVNPKRVAWQCAQNLPFDEPELVAKLMAATAELSPRCRNACYHVMIAWERAEQPTPEVMQAVALRALALMGLGDHQALVMGHGDKVHPHLHMMINRVHPETGRAWSASHDWRRWDRVMQDLSEAHGFRFVPSHRFHPELTEDLEKGPTSRAWRAAKRGAATSRPQWSRRRTDAFADRISEDLDAASGWDDIVALIEAEGMTVAPKGSGFIVGNRDGYAKLSALRLSGSAKGPLVRRRPARGKSVGSSRPWVDGVDIARGMAALGLADRADVRAAVAAAQAKRMVWMAQRPLIEQLLADLKNHVWGSTAQSPVVPRRRVRAAPMRRKVRRRQDERRDR